ncbi:uncharacterized protein LOC134835007 [Culicoides brevitarsis]|uniref:uncharacterized protein LOC134835007 n=1 Tax=Culicoides brevitarsis TaxID=469753 RepID=UPI00307B5EBF
MSALDELPEFQNFCFCINLETGVIFISLLTFLLPEFSICAKILILTHETTSLTAYEWRQEMKLDLLDIVGSVLGPVFACILLVGVVKKSHSYLLTFLFFGLFSLVIYSLDTLLNSFAHTWTSMIKFSIIIVYIYFWMCVQSLYQKYRRLDPDFQYLLAVA